MRKQKRVYLLAAMLCLCLLPRTVYASEDRKGSLTIVDIDDTVCLQYVAGPDAGLTDAFSQAPVEDLAEEKSAVSNARILHAFALEQNIPGLEGWPDDGGTVFYGQLDQGLYLVYSLAEKSEFDPFLVKIPTEVGGKVLYDVKAAPKEEPPTEPDTTPSDPTDPAKPTEPESPTEPNLPQTGESVWPKYILLALGGLAAVAGIADLILGREKKA